jgi:metal-responsive CopG/Arc/MetJ family transcriptional regulator
LELGFTTIADATRRYNYLVRVKTSITLPAELIDRLDRVDTNRSALLEQAALAYLAQRERRARDEKDTEIINRNAQRLNQEAMDALDYQRLP